MNNPSGIRFSEAVVSLAATLVVAESWTRRRRDHRAGLDPAAQESTVQARDALRQDAAAARVLVHRLRVEAVATTLREPEGEPLHDFALLLAASRLIPVVHRLHQRLMSLYPSVTAESVERARHVEGVLRAVVDADVEPPQPAILGLLGDLNDLLEDAADA